MKMSRILHFEAKPVWEQMDLSPTEWLAYELVSYYTSSLTAEALSHELYAHAWAQSTNWAIMWEEGERETVYDQLPPAIVQYIGLEPL